MATVPWTRPSKCVLGRRTPPPARIPENRGLGNGRGGRTHTGTTTGKRGDAEGTPPQTLVFVFLDTSLYDLLPYLPIVAQVNWVMHPCQKKGRLVSMQSLLRPC